VKDNEREEEIISSHGSKEIERVEDSLEDHFIGTDDHNLHENIKNGGF